MYLAMHHYFKKKNKKKKPHKLISSLETKKQSHSNQMLALVPSM